MGTPSKSINAWIYVDEDEPPKTSYRSYDSCYQTLIRYSVYQNTDMVNICFFDTLPTPGMGYYMLQLSNLDMKHPDGSTNADYLKWLVRDTRTVNPRIKLLATLNYNTDTLSRIFSSAPPSEQQKAVDFFARSVLNCMLQNDLDGFDIDWEGDFSTAITQAQFAMLFSAIRKAFDSQTSKHYYLTLSPADVGYLDATTVNNCFDFVNLQLYSGFTDPSEFIEAGVRKDLLAYGAKFESIGNGDMAPYQTAQNAVEGYNSGNYTVMTQWRLNSGDFQYEQAQQIILYQLAYGSAKEFDDIDIVGAAGNPPITSILLRSGDVLDAIMPTYTGKFETAVLNYQMPQHGGNGGNPQTVTLDAGDVITQVSGHTGVWFGWNCILQITLHTRNGKTYGPFGTMNNATVRTPFRLQAPAGQSAQAFQGTLVNVALAGGGTTNIIATLNVTWGAQAELRRSA
jgi:hypothetical protein